MYYIKYFNIKCKEFLIQICIFCRNEKKDLIQKNKKRNFTIISLPFEMVAYIAIHTFGIRMMYPGSTKLFQYFMSKQLLDGILYYQLN